MGFTETFNSSSLDARWAGSTATLDDANDRVNLPDGYLQSISDTFLFSEKDIVDITLNLTLTSNYTNLFIAFPNISNSQPSAQIQVNRGGGVGSGILAIQFRENQYESFSTAASSTSEDLTGDFDLRIQRNSSGEWTISVGGTGVHTDIAEPAGLTSFISSEGNYEGVIRLSQTAGAYVNSIVSVGAAPDVTAPVLSSPTGTETGSSTASGTVTTDEDNGTLYYYVSQNASENAATITGSGSTQVVNATGVQNVSVTGLTAETTYYLHYVHTDAASNESNVVSSASFTTDAGVTRGITDINSTNVVAAGNTGIVITTVGLDASPVTQEVTLGGENLTITNWTSTAVTVDIPLHIDLEWGSIANLLRITDDTGVVSLGGVALLKPTTWDVVIFNGLPPNEVQTESMYEYTKTDSEVGNFTLESSDGFAWEIQSGLSFDMSTFPTVSPPSTVSAAYKIWDSSLNTWSALSSFTITDAGDFGTTAPDQFTFEDVTGAISDTTYINQQAITGVSAGTVLTAVNGLLSNDGGNTWSSSVVMVLGLTYVRAVVTSSTSPNTSVHSTVVVNGVSDTFTVSTSEFSFDISDVVVNQTNAAVTYTYPIWELWDKIPEDPTAIVIEGGTDLVVTNGTISSIPISTASTGVDYLLIARDSGDTPANYFRVWGQVTS